MRVGPRLNRELAWIVAGIVGAGALVGAGIGVAVDVIWHHHRQPR